MNRRNLWIGAGVLTAGVIFWAVGQAVNPASGDVEFQKTLDSMMQVKSFRGAYSASASGSFHSERLWEVDCNRVIVHQHSQDSQASSDSPFNMNEDQLLMGDQRYTKDSNGSWQNEGYAGDRFSAKWYCDNIARGTVVELLPDLRNMIRHAMTEEGSKKTVNGVKCREWKFALKGALSGGQTGSMCIGVDDHLPYELIVDGGRSTYSDYNRPIQIDVPDASLQPASSTQETN